MREGGKKNRLQPGGVWGDIAWRFCLRRSQLYLYRRKRSIQESQWRSHLPSVPRSVREREKTAMLGKAVGKHTLEAAGLWLD